VVHINRPAPVEAGTAAVGDNGGYEIPQPVNDDGGYEIPLSDFVAPSPPADVNTHETIHASSENHSPQYASLFL